MYAIIKTGGKQYRVSEGQTLKVESLQSNDGDNVRFDDVLIIADGDNPLKIGSPLVKGAFVKAEVVRQGRAEKIEIIKFKRRKHQMKRQGHRQNFTEVKIVGIHHEKEKKEKSEK